MLLGGGQPAQPGEQESDVVPGQPPCREHQRPGRGADHSGPLTTSGTTGRPLHRERDKVGEARPALDAGAPLRDVQD